MSNGGMKNVKNAILVIVILLVLGLIQETLFLRERQREMQMILSGHKSRSQGRESIGNALRKQFNTNPHGRKYKMWKQKAEREQGLFCKGLKSGNALDHDQVGQLVQVNVSTLLPEISPNISFSMYVYGRHDIVSDSIRRVGSWDLEKVKELVHVFRTYSETENTPLSSLTFLDIGANVGWFSFIIAASLGVKVVAFEPMESNIFLMRQTLCRPENQKWAHLVTLHTMGLGSDYQECNMISGIDNIGDGHIHCTDDRGANNATNISQSYRVRSTTRIERLEDVYDYEYPGRGQKQSPIVAVKMDTEGYEHHVIQGGQQLFQQVPYIFTEYAIVPMTQKGGDPKGFLQFFFDHGYRIRRGSDQYLTPSQAMESRWFKSIDDLVIHKDAV